MVVSARCGRLTFSRSYIGNEAVVILPKAERRAMKSQGDYYMSEKRFYETVFIVRQDVSSAHTQTLADEFAKIVKDKGGEVIDTEFWGLKTLAYKINKNRKGHYVMFISEAPHPAIAEMERQMRLHEDVLRYMTLRLDEKPEGPSIMSDEKGEAA